MKSFFLIWLMFFSFGVSAYDKNEGSGDNSYNPRSYGAPTLYYSPEARQEREEIQELREANHLAKELLEAERESRHELRERE